MAAEDPTFRWNWKPITQGDSRPATNFTESASESNLVSVTIRLKLQDSEAADIVLSSEDGGVTINSATAGDWDFGIDEMTAAQTDAYTPGIYSYEMTTVQANGVTITAPKGEWNLIARIPDAP